MLIRRPIPPFASSLCISPSQKRIKINEEKIVEPTTTGCHHTCLMRITIPLATKPITAHMQQMLVSHLVASSQRSLENAHESSGQTISGWSSKNLQLCPKYNKWTRPCNTINTPIMSLNKEFLLSLGKGFEQIPSESAWQRRNLPAFWLLTLLNLSQIFAFSPHPLLRSRSGFTQNWAATCHYYDIHIRYFLGGC